MYSHSGGYDGISTALTSVEKELTITSVPVQLAEAVGLHEHKCACGQRRHREVGGRVLDLDPSATARCHLLLLVGEVEHVWAGDLAVRIIDRLLVRMAVRGRGVLRVAVIDVGVLLRDAGEHAHVHAEVLRDDLERSTRQPVGEHERCACRVEVPVAEDQEDLKTLIERLDRVGDTGWEAGGEEARD